MTNRFLILLIAIVFVGCGEVYAQKLKNTKGRIYGTQIKTIKQVQNAFIDIKLIGKWESSTNKPLLSFYLNEDRTVKFLFQDSISQDSMNIEEKWTTPQMYWTVDGNDLYFISPKEKKNTWEYFMLGFYYIKGEKLYISNICDDVKCIRGIMKSDSWIINRNGPVEELIKQK